MPLRFFRPLQREIRLLSLPKSFQANESQGIDAEDANRRGRQTSCALPGVWTLMRDMGLDFKAPPQTDSKQWRKVETLFQNGFTYHSCGCGPGYRPARQWEIPVFVKEQKQIQAEQQRQRDTILKRRALAAGSAGGNVT